MIGKINFETEIEIKIPIKWIPLIEISFSDLPQFPLIYVHFFDNETRIYGFPACVSFDFLPNNENCIAKFKFLSNVNLEKNKNIKDKVRKEIENRIGTSDKIGVEDVVRFCNGDSEYELFFKKLWGYLSKLYGGFIPFGKFYDEVFSIVRFISAWNPKTGKQSEIRMVYNFMSNFGEEIELPEKWNNLDFYLIPTYKEILEGSMDDFPRFKGLFESMKKAADIFFTKEVEINERVFKYMEEAWNSKTFREKTSELVASGEFEISDKERLDLLVDAFNRHAGRAAFFVWSLININEENDYRKWNKDDFIKFYGNKIGKGCSPKAVACFLQQGFKNTEVIPIDTWVGSFYEHALGIDEMDDFFRKFIEIGKLERLIWLSSQANKTNNVKFFYLLWCTRYGQTKSIVREANPLSCYECQLRNSCAGFKKIKNKKVYSAAVSEPSGITSDADFLVLLNQDNVPKKVYKKHAEGWELLDEFSGLILHNESTNQPNQTLTVESFLSSLPEFSRRGFET